MNFFGKTITVFVTGSIAAYKALDICSLLKKNGATVYAVLTKNAMEFVTPLSFETITGNRVVTDTFNRDFEFSTKHISLATKSDLFIVAPASANIIGKYAQGIADDFASTTLLAFRKKILFAPAMNNNMLENAAVIDNIEALKKRGAEFIEGEVGVLACGVTGRGRLAKPIDIVKKAHKILYLKNDYMGKTVLVSAGATITKIDPVRYITNYSSGKMGLALATSLQNRGAKVILVHGKILVMPKISFYKEVAINTTDELYKAVMQNLNEADIIIMAAAPSDYEAQFSSQKLKEKSLTLELKKGVDIASEVGKIKKDKKLVIFAAESQDLIANAKKKLDAKKADVVVANDITLEGAGFNSDTNIVTIISKQNQKKLPKMLKSQVAEEVLDFFRLVFP